VNGFYDKTVMKNLSKPFSMLRNAHLLLTAKHHLNMNGHFGNLNEPEFPKYTRLMNISGTFWRGSIQWHGFLVLLMEMLYLKDEMKIE
jgi:hypothetical protein